MFCLLFLFSHLIYCININITTEQEFVRDKALFAAAQVNRLQATLKASDLKYPRLSRGSSVTTVSMSDWTSGFFPGVLWYTYELTENTTFRTLAKSWTDTLEPLKTNTGTHDIGFMTYCSFGNGVRLYPSGTSNYKDILIQAARSLITRYHNATHTIKSWDSAKSWHNTTWNYPVIIDNMMNLELLMYASKQTSNNTEADNFVRIATDHANTTRKNHLRSNFSSYHVVDYDPNTGAVKDRATNQGYSDNSMWARGQGWGIYGYTMLYRETKIQDYLDTAERMANYYLTHRRFPSDKVPYWDFDAEQSGYTREWSATESKFPYSFSQKPISDYRDSSAGAVVTSALFELYNITKNETYLENAITALHSLSSDDYLAKANANGNFLLLHTVGNIPNQAEIDTTLIYADYYYLEALVRYRRILEQLA